MAGSVRITLESASFQKRDNGQFAERVEAATNQAAYNAARMGASEAKGILGGKWKGGCNIGIEGGQGSWEIYADGQWAEAAEFGIPGHQISTDKYSLFNPAEGFPRDPKHRLQSVWHTGVPEYRMITTAGDLVSHEFEGILVSELP